MIINTGVIKAKKIAQNIIDGVFHHHAFNYPSTYSKFGFYKDYYVFKGLGVSNNSCDNFPCTRLKQLDKRYKIKYEMSMIDNLKMINKVGIRHFTQNEKLKWICPECGEIICVHKPTCLSCGHKWH